MAKNLLIRVQAVDEEALRKLPLADMDTVCMGGIEQQDDGTLVLQALVPEALAKKLKSLRGIKIDVLADMARVGAKMKKQVARGNRFVDDSWIPRGLGRKVQDEAAP